MRGHMGEQTAVIPLVSDIDGFSKSTFARKQLHYVTYMPCHTLFARRLDCRSVVFLVIEHSEVPGVQSANPDRLAAFNSLDRSSVSYRPWTVELIFTYIYVERARQCN